MHIVCLLKFVPDVDNFSYNYENHTISRENSNMIINSDDAKALGFALSIKKKNPNTFLEVVSMAPSSTTSLIEDVLRVGFDKATLISDTLYAGSDTYATSKILAKYLNSIDYDCILSGTHSLDGDTSHVPSQIAQSLNIDHINNIIAIDEDSFINRNAIVTQDDEFYTNQYQIKFPCIISLTYQSSYRLPYVRYKNLNLDVKDKLNIVTNEMLKFEKNEVGLKGSLTKVVSTSVKKHQTRDKKIVQIDDSGIDYIYKFLKEKGFLKI